MVAADSRARRDATLRARRGWSLIELLVAIAILTSLLALALPALQRAREAARRTECASHLRQTGLALLLYHNAATSFPPGCVARRTLRLSWSALVLPFIEQSSVAARVDLAAPFLAEQNAAAGSTVLSLWLCPSTQRLAEDRVGATSGDRNGNGRWDAGDNLAWIDYGGMFGAVLPSGHDFMNGVLVWDMGIRQAQIRDGASHTILVAEDTGRGAAMDGHWINGENIFDQAGRINAQQNNEMWSDHPGGAQTLMCDGSVGFLAEAIDLPVLLALCTRALGESAAAP
jgi:prepilin-type N-terminal cleavage/methylation domain-containing protein/prepilin-type processing-associated H-X9-DG protein